MQSINNNNKVNRYWKQINKNIPMEFDFAGQFEYHPLDKDKKSAKSSILEHEPLTSVTKLKCQNQ